MTKVLLVYEMVPEETLVYLLDVSEDDLVWMKKCHRRIINYAMPEDCEEACQKLSSYLEDKIKLEDPAEEFINIKDYDLLIISGFGC